MRICYPFTAIVGQDLMKKALLLNAISPNIGGVLIQGEKGTAKSTAVRALANILPLFVEGDSAKMTVVELPVNATEDRVVGTIDLEHALKEGERKFEPGLLAEAHNNILYVDEINLLDDHVVDVLLDAAAMGVNTVEREGISYSHPARFVLVGTMNPEEGDIRPQLLDRFGLSVEIRGEQDVEKRVEIIKRRIAFERDREAFIESYKAEEKALADKVLKARELVQDVEVSDDVLSKIAELSIALAVDGHRSDITMLQTSRAIAALADNKKVGYTHLREAAELVLPHRMRRKPFEEASLKWDVIDNILNEGIHE